MLICHDVARGIDDESRTEALQALPDLARLTPVVAKELSREILKRVTDLAPYYGKDWTAKDLARLHGLLLGKDRLAKGRTPRSLFPED